MKRLAIRVVFVVVFALGMLGQTGLVQQVTEGDQLAVNWNSRVKK
jgi:hypothetical protein